MFDDGWHKLATALWLFGPVAEVRAWIGSTEVVPGDRDGRAHHRSRGSTRTGCAACGTSRSPPTCYLRSDYYTNDERWEITGRRGYARVNRCTGRGIQQPSLEVYADGELTRVPRPRRRLGAAASATPGATGCGGCTPATGPLWWSGEEAVDVLRFALAAYESSAAGGIGVAPGKVG